MGAHTVKFFIVGQTTQLHTCRCACGWSPGKFATRQLVEDEVFKHQRDVERIKAHLVSREPSLRASRDHYRQMEADPSVSASDRVLWGRLADEIEHRLNEAGQTGQETLPF